MGIGQKRGWGFRPGQNILEHYFKGTQYLGNISKAWGVRGGQGLAKRVGALFKEFVLLDFFKGFFFFIWEKCSRGGWGTWGLGMFKSFKEFFFGILAIQKYCMKNSVQRPN